MKYSEARAGRVFIIRLEHGDILHDCIEEFCAAKNVEAASVTAVGAADSGSTFVVGPTSGYARPVVPMTLVLDSVREVTGVGTVFPDESGSPVLHMHLAGGRGETTITGCVRQGVKVWQVLEVVLTELAGLTARRVHDASMGFGMLEV